MSELTVTAPSTFTASSKADVIVGLSGILIATPEEILVFSHTPLMVIAFSSLNYGKIPPLR